MDKQEHSAGRGADKGNKAAVIPFPSRRSILKGIGAGIATAGMAAGAFAAVPLDADRTGPLVGDDAGLVNLWRRRVEANAAWDAALGGEPRRGSPGYRRWKAQYEAAAHLVSEIDAAILATPAVGPAGMVIKARIAAEPDMGDTELDLSQKALQSLLADLERLTKTH